MFSNSKLGSKSIELFDFDGTLFDTNKIKARNIQRALASEIVDDDELRSAVDYFMRNSGLPRELKIQKLLKQNQDEALRFYEKLNALTLYQSLPIPDALAYLKQNQTTQVKNVILSGGDRQEIEQILKHNNAANLITDIYAGPKTKSHNMQQIIKKYGDVAGVKFFGDSKIDFDVAASFSMEFVFIHGYAHDKSWFENNEHNVRVFHDFSSAIEELFSGLKS